MNQGDLVAILQASIAPCVLISGVGLLLLSMTNRLGRPIDRIRQLCALVETEPQRRQGLGAQVRLLLTRCRVLRAAIALAVASIGAFACIIGLVFAGLLYNLGTGSAIQFCFTAGILCLLGSLGLLLADVSLTLTSLRLEIRDHFDSLD
jgi:hypothetical protein